MRQKPIDVQTAFLIQVWDAKTPVTVFLMNGIKINGTLKGFDAFTIEIESRGKQQTIYKHAVSIIAPLRPTKISQLPGRK